MFATPKSFAPRAVPMSVFLPHVDASFSFEEIARQFEEEFEVGKVDRIEAVPKFNQKDGHAYHACFVYFSQWGNSYYAQMLRMQLMAGLQTRMYVAPSLYWMVGNNTSSVNEENIPFPKHMSLLMFSNEPTSLADVAEVLEMTDIGKVNLDASRYMDEIPLAAECAATNAYLEMAEDEENTAVFMRVLERPAQMLVVEMEYWFHSKPAHEFQQALQTTGAMNYGGFVHETTRWSFVTYPESPNTSGINPYVWYAPSPAVKNLNMNDVYAYGTLMQQFQSPLISV
jgi:hypothetical protein